MFKYVCHGNIKYPKQRNIASNYWWLTLRYSCKVGVIYLNIKKSVIYF